MAWEFGTALVPWEMHRNCPKMIILTITANSSTWRPFLNTLLFLLLLRSNMCINVSLLTWGCMQSKVFSILIPFLPPNMRMRSFEPTPTHLREWPFPEVGWGVCCLLPWCYVQTLCHWDFESSYNWASKESPKHDPIQRSSHWAW